jgi:DNA-binding transcriptional MerR regulator
MTIKMIFIKKRTINKLYSLHHMFSENDISPNQDVEQFAQALGISRSLIRFWEEEFALSERANGTMSPREVAEIRLIHNLILEKELTLEDAKAEFSEKHVKVAQKFEMLERLQRVKDGLVTLRDQL